MNTLEDWFQFIINHKTYDLYVLRLIFIYVVLFMYFSIGGIFAYIGQKYWNIDDPFMFGISWIIWVPLFIMFSPLWMGHIIFTKLTEKY